MNARFSARSGSLVAHEGALIVPWIRRRYRKGLLPITVFDRSGARIEAAESATNARSPKDFEPEPVHRREDMRLDGTWLYGGLATAHFGHQITRMMGRLPWLERAGPVDGIVFAALKVKCATAEERAMQTRLLSAFGIDAPVHIAMRNTRVERLIVGPELFGEGAVSVPDPRFVAWARRAIGLDAFPIEPGRKIYVTRSGLGAEYGRILCEEVLEENMRAAGYEVFAPEAHDLETQIATYASAETIVMTDGSPGHVSAFVQRPGQTQIVIARRQERPDYLLNHMEGFAPPGGLHYVEAVRRQWWPPERAKNVQLGELDFDALRGQLVALGAVPETAPWRAPTPEDLERSKGLGLPPGTTALSDREHGRLIMFFRRIKRIRPMMKDLDTRTDLPPITGLRYLRALQRMHARLRPEWYLEVGTFEGKSLQHARGNFIAVDPMFRIKHPIVNESGQRMFLFQETSDDFFASGFLEANGIAPSLGFLDGLHHFEVLLRDFMNAEKRMARNGVIVLHDCCPTSHAMTSRLQGPGNWTGDVWKTLLILKRHRPDLRIDATDAKPTGLVVIRGLDAESTVLDSRYDSLVAEYAALELDRIEGGLLGYYDEIDVQPIESVLDTLSPT